MKTFKFLFILLALVAFAPTQAQTAEEIISEHVKGYDFPICFGFPSGHIDGNRSIILGVRSVLEIHENGVNLSQS